MADNIKAVSAKFSTLPVSLCHSAMKQDGSTTKPWLNLPCCRASSVFSVKYVFSSHCSWWLRLGHLQQACSWHMAMAWMMIGKDLANMTHHLGSQSETQIMISLTAFMYRSFGMQQKQLDIYSKPALLEVAWVVGEENVTTHLAIIRQEPSGKEILILLPGL